LNCPVLLIVPLPVADQVIAGCDARALPNWSRAVAVNCCVPLGATVAVPGETVTEVSAGLTVTVTWLVTLRLPGSVMVTWKVYVPTAAKVALVFLAALVPLALKLTDAGGEPVRPQV